MSWIRNTAKNLVPYRLSELDLVLLNILLELLLVLFEAVHNLDIRRSYT
jgi:hypothetical protein